MKNNATYFKYGVILFIFIMCLLVFRGCICNGNTKGDEIPKIETVRVDTFWNGYKVDTFYTPAVGKISKPKTITLHDTLEMPGEYLPVDTAAILQDYYSTAHYSDTQHIPQGTIVINDAVTKNRIASRNLIADLQIPTITKTVTITEQYPRRVVLYAGGGLFGNQTTPIWGIEGNLGIQFKNLKMYSVGYMINKTGDPLYTFRFALPLRLRRK